MAHDLVVRPYDRGDERAVIALWERCGLVVPWNDPTAEIRRKVEFQPELFLVGTLDERIVATVMAGYEGRRGWINDLGVCPDHRRQGHGRRMVEAAEALLRDLGCPKINLQVRTSSVEVLDFYRRLGYTLDEVVSLGKRIE